MKKNKKASALCSDDGCRDYAGTSGLCRLHYQRKWRSDNSHRVHVYTLRHAFGLTLEQYQDILDSQGGGCGICGCSPPPTGRFPVDHDHGCCPVTGGKKTCGKCIRGLLCHRCNTRLATIEDEGWMRSALSYLARCGQ